MDKAPVYKYPGEYARDHDVLKLYRVSGKANIACKNAIEAAIWENYQNNVLNTSAAIGAVVKQFGYTVFYGRAFGIYNFTL